MPLARISLTLSRHFSLSFITSGRSSGLHPVSSHSCCMYVQAGCTAFARPYEGVRRSTSLMSSSLLLPQCHACPVRLTWIVFVMGGRGPYSLRLVGCYRQELFKIARNILVYLPSSFFSSRFVSVQVVHPYSIIDTTAAWKKLRFILSVRSDFHMIDSLSIATHAFVSRVSMSFSVDETLLRFCLVWKCRLFDYSTYIQFCVHWHGGQCLRRLVPNYAVVFRLGYLAESLHHRRSRRRYCFCGVPSASFLCQFEAVFSALINRCSKKKKSAVLREN